MMESNRIKLFDFQSQALGDLALPPDLLTPEDGNYAQARMAEQWFAWRISLEDVL